MENTPATEADAGPGDSPALDVEPTGVPRVDAVLADVAAVAQRPVGEHVAVFERAHDQLRRALDADPDAVEDGQPADPDATDEAHPADGAGA